MTATLQLALLLDARRDVLSDAEVAAVEAAVAHADEHRDDYARPARPCRCGPRAWGEGDGCIRCGHTVASSNGWAP